jgi:uncharacterized protein YndB with AHSA1/START domain
MTQTNENSAAADRESVHIRALNASRAQVAQAFRQPEHFAQWWGPKGFRNTIYSFDYRPGGRLHLTLHGPDGADYENEYVIEELAEPERVVISHPDPAHYFQLFLTLAEEGDKTRLTWRQRFDTREHFERVQSFVAEANEQNLDRLEALLKRMQTK